MIMRIKIPWFYVFKLYNQSTQQNRTEYNLNSIPDQQVHIRTKCIMTCWFCYYWFNSKYYSKNLTTLLKISVVSYYFDDFFCQNTSLVTATPYKFNAKVQNSVLMPWQFYIDGRPLCLLSCIIFSKTGAQTTLYTNYGFYYFYHMTT